MQIEQIVAALIAERDRLSRAIDALKGSSEEGKTRPGAARKAGAAGPGTPLPRRRRLSAAARKAISEAAKRRWAAVKATKAR